MNAMRAFSVLLGVFLFSLLLPCAQAQELQPPSWELGWITDVDPKYIVELEDDWDVEGELVVFVNNERSNELNLALNYDFDEDGPFAFDGPESITVAANTNDSFTILISGVSDKEVRAFSPSSSLPLTLTAEESIGETSVGNQEIEAEITVPRKYRLMPSIVPPQDTLFSGSWVEFSIEVSNLGNTQDAITIAEATIRSCPHLSVVGLEQLENKVVAVTNDDNSNAESFTLRLEASSSHQERQCEVSLAVTSEGDDTTRSTATNVQVVAPEVEQDVRDDDDDDTTSDGSAESTSLPWTSVNETILALFISFLFISNRKQRFQ